MKNAIFEFHISYEKHHMKTWNFLWISDLISRLKWDCEPLRPYTASPPYYSKPRCARWQWYHLEHGFHTNMSDIGKRISDIESSISDLLSAVNILERDIANFANISFSSQVKSNLDPKSSSSQTLHSLSSHTQTSPTNTPHVRFTASAYSSSTLNRLNVNTIPSTASSPTSTLPQGHTPPATPSSTLSHHRARTAPFNSSSSISTHPNKSLLILGDSNTRHVKFHNISFTRIPTFTIQAVDPYKCKGFAKVWIHVGINSLKRCHTPYDVERCFQMFMKKIEQIQKVSPSSKLIVSPILPTGIPLLNAKALLFNARLFSVPRHWSILNFSVFADKNNTLSREFRSFRNRQDLIHLGYRGISTLTDMVARQLYSVDHQLQSPSHSKIHNSWKV